MTHTDTTLRSAQSAPTRSEAGTRLMMAAPLPPGFKLDAYTIHSQIGGGGFSAVYLAHATDGSEVAIKEYLPLGVVERGEGGLVRPITEKDQAVFRYGMRCFFEEARTLANFEHPNVVRVTSFFRANDTVYMVMRYEHGKTLQRLIQSHEGPFKERFLIVVFIQLLNGLREVHSRKLLHLDIKPANIYIRKDGSPVLMDFGAARQALAQGPRALAPMYTPGYAAPEYYQERERIGPWTDIYSVGASIYACLGKAPPPPADKRMESDIMTPAAKAFAGDYSRPFLELVDEMLILDHTARPQSVFVLQKRLVEMARAQEKNKSGLLATIKEKLGFA